MNVCKKKKKALLSGDNVHLEGALSLTINYGNVGDTNDNAKWRKILEYSDQ